MADYNYFLENALAAYNKKGLLRKLKSRSDNVFDFDSNDFLGLACNAELRQIVLDTLSLQTNTALFGSTGSRLVSGNFSILEETETWLADFFKTESTLLCKSGFEANHIFFGYVPQRFDTIIYDSEIHASIKTTARLSGATCLSFRHNDIDDLLYKASHAKGNIFIAVESVYSISGDIAPLKKLADICHQHHWLLIVDEAHTTGLSGSLGEGLCCELGIKNEVFARIHTFGKAVGCAGAVIAGSHALKDFLINFAVPAIYSTAMPPVQAIAIRKHLEFIQNHPELKLNLLANIKNFKTQFSALGNLDIEKPGHIYPLSIGNATITKKIALELNNLNISIKAMLPPTTSGNASLLRITIHSQNNFHEIDYFFNQLRKLL
jgi:8-amino-7-oxononanoate synthase